MRSAAASLLLCGVATAQPVRELPPVTTDLVHVDVVATDGRGRVVRDLVRGDFELYVDGRATAIELFEPPSPGREAAVEHDGRPRLPAATTAARWLVLSLDAGALTPAGRRRVLEGLEDWTLRQVSGGARLLVTVSDGGMRVLEPPSTSYDDVRRVLATAAAAPVRGASRASADQAVRESIRELVLGAEALDMSCADVFHSAQSLVEVRAQQRTSELRAAIDNLAGLVAALATLPGSKALLYLSEGLEQRPALELFHHLREVCPEALHASSPALAGALELYDLSRDWQELAARANAARVTFYPVDAAGLRTASVADVAHEQRRFAPTSSNDRVREANERAAPGILAEATGGVALHSRNRPASALAIVEDSEQARYALGFVPKQDADGRTSSLRVEVRRRGVRLRHRQSFRLADPGDALVRQAWSTLLLGLERRDLDLEIDTRFDADGGLEVVLRAGASLAALPSARVVILHRGRSGIEAREKVITLLASVVVRIEGAQAGDELAVGVRDSATGRVSVRRLGVGERTAP
jgi:VWFA-related protein